MFNKNKVKSSEELATTASRIVNVFSQTINGLRGVVADARSSISAKEEEIAIAQAEKAELEHIVSSNESIISKIEGLLQ